MHAKFDGTKDLSHLIVFGRDDDAQSAERVRTLLDGITCRDLEQLLSCESFKPQIFGQYLKMMHYLSDVQQDCCESQAEIFGG